MSLLRLFSNRGWVVVVVGFQIGFGDDFFYRRGFVFVCVCVCVCARG